METQMHKRKRRFKLTTARAVIIGSVLISLSILIGNIKVNVVGSVANADVNKEKTGIKYSVKIENDDHVRGNKSAKITIVEYSDFECPYCKMFDSTMKEVSQKYPNDIAWVYRHYPLSIHPKAQKEAEASECVASLGGESAFWKFADRIFEITPSNNGLDLAILPQIASDAGVDVAKFNECLSSGKMADVITLHKKSAEALGINATPNSFILFPNGNVVPVQGAEDASVIKKIIEEGLRG